MKNIYVRLSTTSKMYLCKTEEVLSRGDMALLIIDRIIEEGIVIEKPELKSVLEENQGEIVRKETDEDHLKIIGLRKQARSLVPEAQKKIVRHGLKMKILNADISFDEKKLTFYFSADSRVDFRSLVTDLAKSYNKLIRLQQVGSRDEAKYFGGIGKCGRELCCSKFLKNLESITLEMAEIQDISTSGSAKLSGSCGKLMCCLAYEADSYGEIKKKMPKIGSEFSSQLGSGRVVGHNILENKVVLETQKGEKIEVLL